jgi:hypothetical protein
MPNFGKRKSGILKAVVALGAAAAIVVAIAESHAQSQDLIMPPMSHDKSDDYKANPGAYSQFLTRLPRQPTGELQQYPQPVSPPTGGTWQNVAAAPDHNLCTPLLLTDGTVIVHSCNTANWYKLTPDISGNYTTGTWSTIATMPVIGGTQYAPQFHASAVLPDGRVIIVGGEYNGTPDEIFTNLGAIYDPAANTWTAVSPPSGWAPPDVGDAGGVVLPNGTYMLAGCCKNPEASALFNPSTLGWTPTGSPINEGYQEKQGHVLLPNDLVLTVDLWSGNGTVVERYDPSTGTWSIAGSTPVSLGNPCGNVLTGPALTRPDGTVVAFGGNALCNRGDTDPTAIYTTSSNSWVLGPNIPAVGGDNYNATHSPAAMLPNGNILFAAGPTFDTAPTHFFEFSAAPGNTIAQVADPVQDASSLFPIHYNFVVLPNGQILMTDLSLSSAPQVYTSAGAPNPAWRPTVSTVTLCLIPGTENSLSGTQLSGLSQGVAYSTYAQTATNYPIVRIVNNGTGHVFYARTFGHSTVSIAPGQAGRTNFKVAAATELGPSTLFVVANGIVSAGTPVTIASSCPVSLTDTRDFNGDGNSDILFRHSSTGAVYGWLMNGGAASSSATIGTLPTSWQIVGQRDFNGDGKADILWRDTTTGTVKLWLMNGLAVIQDLTVAINVPSNFVIAGVGDFNGDGKADILWRNSSTGTVSMWLMNGGTMTQTGTVGTVANTWAIIGTTPNGHILWRNSSSGALTLWDMNKFAVSQSHNLGAVASVWSVVGIGDFDGNGSDDLLFRNSSTGAVAIWFVTNGVVTSSASLGTVAAAWSIDLTGDFNNNGKSDIVWTHSSGARLIWFMNGATIASTANLGTVAPVWVIQSMAAE